jgi:hypothetical protein
LHVPAQEKSTARNNGSKPLGLRVRRGLRTKAGKGRCLKKFVRSGAKKSSVFNNVRLALASRTRRGFPKAHATPFSHKASLNYFTIFCIIQKVHINAAFGIIGNRAVVYRTLLV